MHYDLLFERFLNPDRVSMPDIDIDFDDEGRGRVMDYVIQKYGSNRRKLLLMVKWQLNLRLEIQHV